MPPRKTPAKVHGVDERREDQVVDPRLRPFIVAIANAIIRDILRERERRDEQARGDLRKT